MGYTFLACVLVGLSRAPDLVPLAPGVTGSGALPAAGADLLRIEDVGAVVAPAGALGGAAVLACAERGIPVIAVHNPCILNVSAAALGLEVLPAESYAAAAGLLVALREGISPSALVRPLQRLNTISADRPSGAGESHPGPGQRRDDTPPHAPC